MTVEPSAGFEPSVRFLAGLALPAAAVSAYFVLVARHRRGDYRA